MEEKFLFFLISMGNTFGKFKKSSEAKPIPPTQFPHATYIPCKKNQNGSYRAGVRGIWVDPRSSIYGLPDETTVNEIISRLTVVETHQFSKHYHAHLSSYMEIFSAWGVVGYDRDPTFKVTNGSYGDFQKRWDNY